MRSTKSTCHLRPALGVVAAGLLAGNAAGGIDHLEAMVIARTAVSGATVVKIQDERFDGIDDSFEVELISSNGGTKFEVEIDAQSGDVNHIKDFNQTNSERNHWLDIFDLLDTANLNYQDAIQRAYSRYPNAMIYEMTLNIEQGRLEYDIPLDDGDGLFQIEVDARNGNIDDPNGDGGSIDVGDAVDVARADVPNGTVVKAKLLKRKGNWEYKIEVATNNGARETHLWIDDNNGAIKKRRTRDTSAGEQNKNQQVMNLWPQAREDFIDAMWLARTELGNARPKLWSLKVVGGPLKYKVKMLEVDRNRSVLVDARNGNVS